MASQSILLVEDEPDIAELIRHHLTRTGFEVDVIGRGDLALDSLRNHQPDLLILDLMLPGMDGLELCRMVKRDEALASVPVVMLTAKSTETDRIVGLELGADDYIVKPFSPREVVLRVQAVLRRFETSEAPTLTEERVVFGKLVIDPPRLEVRIDGELLKLTATEYKLLSFLVSRSGRVQSRETLLGEVWGYSEGIDSRTVDTHVRRLRKKLGPESDRIETLIGFGYRFRRDPSRES